MKQQQDKEITEIWQKYLAGRDHHNKSGMYELLRRCHRFYEGDQWHGLQSGGEELPMHNFIKPICKHKIATVALNDTAIIYSPVDGNSEKGVLCEELTRFAAKQWEHTKMDTLKWDVIKNACITGDHYVYCFDSTPRSQSVFQPETPRLKVRLIDRTNVYLSDEQCSSLNEQEWIIIAERIPVAQARKTAKRNGVAEDEIDRIVSDEMDNTQTHKQSDEVANGDGKCMSLLYMQKTSEGIRFCRSTKSVIYEPEQCISGLSVYPLAGFRWEEKKGTARGNGVVEALIANQIEYNKTLARRAICVKRYSFPTIVYDDVKIENPNDLGKVGASIPIHGLNDNPISSIIQYLTPAAIGGDAIALQHELETKSRELEGAGDAATGDVDPTKASGEAIKAARDQSALPLNEQAATYRQFVEDIAQIWHGLWLAFQHSTESENDADRLSKELDIDIRIDVSPTDPYSVLAREIALENALSAGHITFEEYIEALDANSGVPKEKFKKILQARSTAQMEQQALVPQSTEAQPVFDMSQPMTQEVIQNAMPAM